MNYNEQMKWIDYQIKNLEAELKSLGDDFYMTDEEQHLKALKSIKRDYEKAHERSIELSWIESPERMGR